MAKGGKKVVILGGGIAGMSAAHELVERGFEVEVFERKVIPGGKARSVGAEGATGLVRFGPAARGGSGGAPLPGEHGFRFFPGFYRHVVDTMARIPRGGGSVADSLVDTNEIEIAGFDRPSYFVPTESPRRLGDLGAYLSIAIATASGRAGVSVDDGVFFAAKMWEILTSCEERRLTEYERINWWDFIEAGARPRAYQKYFGNGITRSLVAAKARRASAKTIGDIFLQIVFNVLLPGAAADRVLDGPTNDVWIEPWLAYLEARGVVYRRNATVRSLICDGGVVSGALVERDGAVREVGGDYFIGALPVERMAELISPELLALDPSLANVRALTEYVEWMNGIQFFLNRDVPVARGHTIYIDSPWALTSISQPQFWRQYDLASRGDGAVRGILSVDISDWDVEGLNGKEAQHCSREEIALEAWRQIKRSLNVGGEILSDADLHSWFLDPDIGDVDADGDPATPRIDTNAEPLLVNYVDTWRLRPEAATRIPNFFLASDYVRTYTDLATMEAANEASRRAVNEILRAAGRDAEPCQIWNLHEPEIFLPFRAHDRVRYRKGLPWLGSPLEVAPWLYGATRGLMASIPTPGEPGEEGNAEQVAAGARASSEGGLRRLRITGGA
jgi:uncharacterized protein with NAD-binding domain and iron-sulfur cluster